MTGTERRIRLARALRIVFAVIAALDGLVLTVDLAQGSPVAAVPAACVLVMLFLVIVETRLIGTLQRTRRLNWRAEQLELAAKVFRDGVHAATGITADFEVGFARLGAALGPCAHPAAEPVDLSTGERVAWVCPDCDANLPAAWTPARVTGTLTATASVSGVAALSGSGSLSAKARVTGPACDCGKCGEASREFDKQFREQVTASQGIPPAQVTDPPGLTDGEVKDATEAAVHFAQLARAGRESCISPCRLCEARDRHYPTPEARALLAAKLAGFKDDASLRDWIERERWI